MRFMICVIDDRSNSGTPEEMTAIDALNDRLIADGHWVFACGLQGPTQSVLIDARGSAPVIEERSLADGPDFVSGFWILDLADLRSARDLAVQASRACNRRVELRPLIG